MDQSMDMSWGDILHEGRGLRYEAHANLWSIEVCGRGENSTIVE